MPEKSKKTLLYVSPLMKGWEVRAACRTFIEQEAATHAVQTEEAPAIAGERIGCF